MFQVTGLKSTYGVLAITEAASGQTENTSCKLKGAEVRESKHGVAESFTGLPRDLVADAKFYSRPCDNCQNYVKTLHTNLAPKGTYSC